jgi:hypothetical protein
MLARQGHGLQAADAADAAFKLYRQCGYAPTAEKPGQ